VKKSRIRELYERYVDAVESWQIKLAIARIRDFRIPPDSWDDTMQELAIVVHEFQFDPARANGASEETILCRFFDRRIKMLARSNARHLALRNRIGRMSQEVVDTCLPEDRLIQEEVHIPVRFRRRNGRQMILTDGDQPAGPERDANQTLIEAIAKAHRWQACPAIADRRRGKQIEAGQYAGIEDLAQAVGVGRTYVGRMLRLTSLAPDIVEATLRGDDPDGMSLGKLRKNLPVRWDEQRKKWG